MPIQSTMPKPAAAAEKLEEQERTIKALREQNAQLKVALIRWRQQQWPNTDQTAVIERDFPKI